MDAPELNKREQWSRALDFLLACIGFSVGLGNVWRFPYLCYKNGGGAFLIPYFLCVVVGSIPLFYLEVALGQFMSRGGMQAWKLVPLFQGIGLASCIIVFFLNCYYNVILAWAIYYLINSCRSTLVWDRCDNAWNNKTRCTTNFTASINVHNNSNNNSGGDDNINDFYVDPVVEFWEKQVLDISDGIEDVGTVKGDLAGCLMMAWVIVYFCICKGIKTTGKVVYVTATMPYFFMMILIIRNSMLEGAGDGIKYYLTPNISRLADIEVWVDAGTQIFFSSSISLGALTALGSYNKFNYDSYRDSVLFAIVNSGTSLLAGFIVFSILGFMAHKQGKHIKDVAESGPGLAFIAYPKAVAQMPLAPFWSFCFFLMLIFLGLDSQFVGVEGVVTTVVDQYPRLLRRGYRKEMFVAVICFLMFLVGLSMVTRGGMYVFQLFDYYSGSRVILLVAFFELVAISYVYGVFRFVDNVRMMIGDSFMTKTLPYMTVCWAGLSPAFCLAMFTMSVLKYSELTYSRPGKKVYHYPGWAVALGWTMAASAAIWVPVVGLYQWIRQGANLQALRYLCQPEGLKRYQLRSSFGGASPCMGPGSTRRVTFRSTTVFMASSNVDDGSSTLVRRGSSDVDQSVEAIQALWLYKHMQDRQGDEERAAQDPFRDDVREQVVQTSALQNFDQHDVVDSSNKPEETPSNGHLQSHSLGALPASSSGTQANNYGDNEQEVSSDSPRHSSDEL